MTDRAPRFYCQAMARRKTINHALAGALLCKGQSYDEVAPQVGAKTGAGLRQALLKKGINKSSLKRIQESDLCIQSVSFRVASQASKLLQSTIGTRTQTAAEKLPALDANPTYDELERHVPLLEGLARVGKALYGWGENDNASLVHADLTSTLADSEPQAIVDIEAKQLPDAD